MKKNTDENTTILAIADKIQHIRTSRNLTLQEVAAGTGFSPSFLSMLENGKCGINFSNLQKLLKFYNITLADVLKDQQRSTQDKVVYLKNAKKVGPDIEGVEVYVLTNGNNGRKMEPLLFIVQPGAYIGYMRHEGEEFGHVIQGSFEVLLRDPLTQEEERYILNKGDTIYHESTFDHKYTNISTKPSIFIATVTPPTF